MAATPMTSPGIKLVLGDVPILSTGIWKAWTKAIHRWLLVNHCAYCVEIDVLTTKVVEAGDNSASSVVLTDEAEQVEQPATAFPSSSSHTSRSPVLDNAVALIILEKRMSKEDWADMMLLDSAYDVWKELEHRYSFSSLSEIGYMKKRLWDVKWKPGDHLVDTYLKKFTKLKLEAKGLGGALEEQDVLQAAFNGLLGSPVTQDNAWHELR